MEGTPEGMVPPGGGIHRKPWHWISLGIIVLVVVLGFGVMVMRSYAQIIRLQSDGLNTGLSTQAAELAQKAKTVSGPQRQLEQGDFAALGSDNPQVTIVEFGDFQCPFSGRSYLIMHWLEKQYGDRIRILYRHFPIATIHDQAARAAEAAECARDQGKFWEFHDALYANQESLSPEQFEKFANTLKLDVPKFRSCIQSGAKRDRILKDVQDGLDAGVQGTPTFFVNGYKIQGFVMPQSWEQILKQLLR